jgi:predicted amidohydrolase
MSYDLIIRNARVIDPASGMDVVGDVAVLDGVIVSGMCALHTSDCGVASGGTITQRIACSSTFVK